MRLTGDWIRNAPTQAVCRALESAGYQALFVGGCVRDDLLGMPVRDIDIATDARPEHVITLADAAGLKAVPTGIEHGTITVIASGLPHEVTTFRKDVETDGRRATVAFSDDVEEDARRRDFTMNALYARSDGKLIDPLNGLPDLQAGHVRFIEDPEQRIREDYLRILRFFRFHAWYGSGGLDEDGLAACATLADGIQTLSKERVGSEVLKLLAAPEPAAAVASMRGAGILRHILPGADDGLLGPLVHLEQSLSVKVDPIRRLAALGGSDQAEHLRLSRAQVKQLSRIQDGLESMFDAGEIGYRFGKDAGVDILLLRSAAENREPSATELERIAQGASADFPVSAADLMPGYQGKALGQKLTELETKWIESGFTLGRDDLLGSDLS
ncbi:MAG: CCA tRNA nucleotidyltransferase [Roseovarius sp.]|uniref:CCA tRNA nucleotidyltransferase n=1 Tax=Roseovarius sp. TaxID=1486281 RepID=UPI0032EAA38C